MADANVSKVIVLPTKSVGLSLLLTILFGPLGMLYSTIGGGILMLIISILLGVFTFGWSALITWPICVIWGAMAVNGYNRRIQKSFTS